MVELLDDYIFSLLLPILKDLKKEKQKEIIENFDIGTEKRTKNLKQLEEKLNKKEG